MTAHTLVESAHKWRRQLVCSFWAEFNVHCGGSPSVSSMTNNSRFRSSLWLCKQVTHGERNLNLKITQMSEMRMIMRKEPCHLQVPAARSTLVRDAREETIGNLLFRSRAYPPAWTKQGLATYTTYSIFKTTLELTRMCSTFNVQVHTCDKMRHAAKTASNSRPCNVLMLVQLWVYSAPPTFHKRKPIRCKKIERKTKPRLLGLCPTYVSLSSSSSMAPKPV